VQPVATSEVESNVDVESLRVESTTALSVTPRSTNPLSPAMASTLALSATPVSTSVPSTLPVSAIPVSTAPESTLPLSTWPVSLAESTAAESIGFASGLESVAASSSVASIDASVWEGSRKSTRLAWSPHAATRRMIAATVTNGMTLRTGRSDELRTLSTSEDLIVERASPVPRCPLKVSGVLVSPRGVRAEELRRAARKAAWVRQP